MFLQQELIPSIGLKDALTVILSAITVVIAIFNWRTGRFRIKLKDDLDILSRYREEFGKNLEGDKRYLRLREKIQKRMDKAYVLRRTDVSDVVTAVAFFLSAVVTWLLTEGIGSIWRAGLITILISAGVAFLYVAFKDRGEERM